ncbi:MAG: NAD(P)-dependent alcohol dehydrogenase [Candidatus Woesearchaeota archaeon]|nr:NAD(P)-dependent alcohol dehydrogenase [Candidatus Woesearchaeota archaeon]
MEKTGSKTKVKGYAALDARSDLVPFSFERRALGKKDIFIEILYCGVCHSDLHQVKNEWGGSMFPMVPGHEIIGKVTHIGASVKKFKVGDIAGVGCMVDSCRACSSCKEHEEQFCKEGCTWTYGSPDKISQGVTYGGYSTEIVVDEDFALHISKKLDPAATAPLLCAGITTYSPLKHWKAGPGKKVGIYGLGGLGHMALKFARSFGAHVVQFTTSENKIDDAKRLGAHEVILSTSKGQMDAHMESFDLILDTVSAPHDANILLSLLKRNGSLVTVGVPSDAFKVMAFSLIRNRRSFSGSLIGGIKETQEMLDYCAEKNITSDIELIDMKDINDAYKRLLKSDVKYRFVIDIASLKK